MKFSLEFFKKIDVQVLTTIDNIRIADLRRNISRVKASQDVTSPSTYVQHICQSHFFLCYLFVTYTAMTSHFIGLRSLQLTARRSGYLLFSRISYFNNNKKKMQLRCQFVYFKHSSLHGQYILNIIIWCNRRVWEKNNDCEHPISDYYNFWKTKWMKMVTRQSDGWLQHHRFSAFFSQNGYNNCCF